MRTRTFVVSLILTGIALAAAATELPIFGGSWRSKGPGPIRFARISLPSPQPVTGAVQAIVPHPTNPNILWIGTVNGGIWKTTNALAANPFWTPVGDQLPSLSIGAMALDPSDATHNTLVAGFGRYSSLGDFGGRRAGVVRSTNGGDNWTVLAAPELQGLNITAIAARGNVILVAVDDADAPSCGNAGIFRSTDTGESFTRISGGTGTGLPGGAAFDLAESPSNSAAFFTVIRDAATCTGGGVNGVYYSSDTGASWMKHSPASMDPVFADGGFTGAGLSVDPDGNLAVMVVDDGVASIYVSSVASGAGWRSATQSVPAYVDLDDLDSNGYGLLVGTGEETEFLGGEAVAFLFSRIFAGGSRQPGFGDPGVTTNALGSNTYGGRLFRWDPSAAPGSQISSLTNCSSPTPGCFGVQSTTNNTGPFMNTRDLAFDVSGRLLAADDGGISARANGAGVGNWISLNGNLVIGESQGVGYDSLTNEVFGSLNRLGSAAPLGGPPGSLDFAQIDWDEVGPVAVSNGPTVTRRFTTSGSDGLRSLPPFDNEWVHWRDYNATGLFAEAVVNFPPSVDEIRQIVACGPAVPPQSGTQVIVPTEDGIYESNDNGSTFAPIGSLAGGRAVDCAPNGAIWGISETGGTPGNSNVWIRTGASGPLTQTSTSPSVDLERVAIDPNNPNRAWVTSASNQVFQTMDGGTTWTNVTGNLADAGVFDLHAIEFIDASSPAIAVGADNGVWRLEIAGNEWQRLGHAMPNLPAWALNFNAVDNVLAVGTLGRAFYLIHPVTHGSVLQPTSITVPEGDSGTTVVQIPLTRTAPVTAGATVQYAFQMGTAGDGTFVSGSSTPVAIAASGAASPYPSTINVSGIAGTIQSMRVRINGFSHTFISDVDMMLVAPNGARIMLWSDAGGSVSANNIHVVLDDTAPAALPVSGGLSSGTWRPANHGSSGDTFSAPAPSVPTATALSTFAGLDPNGTWGLYVMDDASGDSGTIAGWSMDFSTNAGDVVVIPGNVAFEPGSATASIPVTIVGDTTPESDESFKILVLEATNLGVVNITDPNVVTGFGFIVGEVTILDDDDPPDEEESGSVRASTIEDNAFGIVVQDGFLDVEDLTITENGVGVRVEGEGSFDAVETTVALNDGAGIHVRENGTLIFVDSTSIDNAGHGLMIESDDDGEVSLTDVEISGNGSSGVLIDSKGDVTIDGGTIDGNGHNGIEIVEAEEGVSISNTDLISNVQAAIAAIPNGETKILRITGNNIEMVNHELGFAVNMAWEPETLPIPFVHVELVNFSIHGNASDGIQIDNTHGRMNVSTILGPGDIFANGGAGIRMFGSEDCDDEEEGCTGATMYGVIIHDNFDAGLVLENAYIIPRSIDETTYGLGFSNNRVFHNAIGPSSCSAEQTAPQVVIDGPVSLPPATEAICTGSATEATCTDAANGIIGGVPGGPPAPCRWSGASCEAVWDLRGSLSCGGTETPNQIHSYNTDAGSGELSVGMYATDGARVWADNNSWRTGTESENVDADPESFIDANTMCTAVPGCGP